MKDGFILEVKKALHGNKKFIYLLGIIIYGLFYLSEDYTLRNQTEILNNIDSLLLFMRKVIYGAMSIYNSIFIVIIVSPMFSQEHEANMFSIIQSAKCGRKTIIINKIATSYFITIVWILFYNIVNVALLLLISSKQGFQLDNIYWMTGMYGQILGGIAIVSICIAISATVKNVFSSSIASLAIIFFPIFMPEGDFQKVTNLFPIISVQLQTYIDSNFHSAQILQVTMMNLAITIVCIRVTFSKRCGWI